MPRVSPFAGLHYSLARFGAAAVPARVRLPEDDAAPPTRVADLTDVGCPPYDVIDEAKRRELLGPARAERRAARVQRRRRIHTPPPRRR